MSRLEYFGKKIMLFVTLCFPFQFVGELIEFKPKVVTVGFERLETSALGLTFQVKPKYVNLGLKLECTASIGSVYWQSFQETPKVSPREQPAISGNWWTSSHASSKQNPKCKNNHNTFYLLTQVLIRVKSVQEQQCAAFVSD